MTTPAPRPLLVAAALALLVALAPGAAGQQNPRPTPNPGGARDPGGAINAPEGPPAPGMGLDGSGDGGHRVVASVNGQPITATDVQYQMMLVNGGPSPEPELQETMVRRIAEQLLLSGEARRLGLELTSSQVDDYWFRRFGVRPDYKASADAAGTSVVQQRALAKRVVVSEIYLLNKVGIRSDTPRIKPDLALQRLVDVTPRQLREYFHEMKEQLDQPAGVSYAIYPCPDEVSAEGVIELLRTDREPTIRPVKETVPLDLLPQVFPYAPELATFARNGVEGALSEPVFIEGYVLVLQITARHEPAAADFEKVQVELRNRIQGNLLTQARQKLVKDLAREAVYWPADLFDGEF